MFQFSILEKGGGFTIIHFTKKVLGYEHISPKNGNIFFGAYGADLLVNP